LKKKSRLSVIDHKLSVLHPSGNKICDLECPKVAAIGQLKMQVEVEGGLNAQTLALYLPEAEEALRDDVTLDEIGLPSELYAMVLHRVDIAKDITKVDPFCLTDAQLDKACSTAECQGGDIIDLHDCEALCDMNPLIKLEQMQELDISGCSLRVVDSMVTVIKAHA
jgi:hypothetical protein